MLAEILFNLKTNYYSFVFVVCRSEQLTFIFVLILKNFFPFVSTEIKWFRLQKKKFNHLRISWSVFISNFFASVFFWYIKSHKQRRQQQMQIFFSLVHFISLQPISFNWLINQLALTIIFIIILAVRVLSSSESFTFIFLIKKCSSLESLIFLFLRMIITSIYHSIWCGDW